MQHFRAMIWAAVSTAEQAGEDKYSLENQLQRCREWLSGRRIQEACAPAIVAGHSREYLSLDAALADIPELGYMIDQARRRAVNLVVLYDLNRWRSLQITVSRALAAYGCQVYSLNQPVEPQRPDVFSPYSSDTAQIVSIISSLTSSLDIANLRRKHAENMPKRVEKRGLAMGRLPYGYMKPPGHDRDPATPSIQVPAEIAVVRWVRDQYVGGASASSIADALNSQKVPTREGGAWTKKHITNMLTNPHYAGLVSHSRFRARRDPITGKKDLQVLPRDQWVTAPGRHQGVWSMEDWLALCELRDERAAGFTGKTKVTYPFSRLLRCSICGNRLWHGITDEGEPHYNCPKRNRGRGTHALIFDGELARQFREVLAEILERTPVTPERVGRDADVEHQGAQLRRLVEENDNARARFQRAYGNGLLSESDLADRLGELRSERSRLESQLAELAASERQVERMASRRETLADVLAQWDQIATGEPERANALLSSIVETVVIERGTISEVRLRSD